jgi:hypothetical protein
MRRVLAFIESHHQALQNALILGYELDDGGFVVPFPASARHFSLLFSRPARRPTQLVIESVRGLFPWG